MSITHNESLKKYSYVGGAFYFRNTLSSKESVSTMAVSKEKAVSNIKYQLKQKFDLPPYAKLDIDISKVKLVEPKPIN